MLDLIGIGNKISSRRKELSMTQDELATKLFVTHQAVSKWENGKSIPTIDVLVELTSLLNISIDYLLDHNEIDEFDYENKFRNYSRETVFNHILAHLEDNQPKDILYLLNETERKKYIIALTNNMSSTVLQECFPYCTEQERLMILSLMMKNKNESISFHHYQLSLSEQHI
jgi:transcriptional regulator with XRE-family HTH domain